MAGFIVRSLALVAGLAVSTMAMAQGAANFPTRPITIVVGYAPGGPPDLVARVIAPAIGAELGQPVIVENKAGAGGVIGYASVARAAPDGYTLLLADIATVTNPFIVAHPGYDPSKDFAWVAPLVRSYMTLLVNPSFPARTVKDFVAMAKDKPGELKFGTSGIGSPPWLGGLAFMRATGIDLLHVPYRGVALAMNDLIAGQISAVWVSFGAAAGQVKAGTLRVLGVYGDQRLESVPDVPTFKENGIDAGVANQGNWLGIAAPTGTPPEIIAKLNAAINKALRLPEVHARLVAADYVESSGGTPVQLKALVDQSVAFWKDLFEKAGVKPE